MKMAGFGDMLLRLNPIGYLRFIQANSFDVHYTGAEANVCVALSQYGVDTCFITKLPDNDIARCAAANLRKYGVDTSGIVWGGERIGIIYVEKGASQRASRVIYDRKHTAFSRAKRQDFCWDTLLEDTDFFHFTGITAALSENMPDILEDALENAKVKNIMVSCDLNYRNNLWSQQKAKRVMEKLIEYADVLIANEEDADKVLGIRAENTDVNAGRVNYEGYTDVAQKICTRYGIRNVAISMRKSISASDNEWSGLLYSSGKGYFSKKYGIHIVDRIGGGDSFAAGIIFGLGMKWDCQRIIEFAVAASCLKQTIELDYNLAAIREIEALVNGDGSGRVQR